MRASNKFIEYTAYGILIDAYYKETIFNDLSRIDKIRVIQYVAKQLYVEKNDSPEKIMSFFYKRENKDLMTDYLDGNYFL